MDTLLIYLASMNIKICIYMGTSIVIPLQDPLITIPNS